MLLVFGINLIYALLVGLFQEGTQETQIAGIYQGKTLFVQNPYNEQSRSFCVSSVFVNGVPLDFNQRHSAIKIDFDRIDLYSPVHIKLVHQGGCQPLVVNPDALKYHRSFSFDKLNLVDTLLTWHAVGEQAESMYVIEKIEMGLWMEQDTVIAKGVFGGASYSYYPLLVDGPNKFRIIYIYPDGQSLNSRELDIHFYPEEVTFRPLVTDSKLFLSRGAEYKIYDGGGTMVMSGRGAQIDVTELPTGEYVVYFDEEYPGVFRKK